MSPKREFTYEELVQATDSFSNATLLGNGHLGHVHKGILPNGKEIAVRKLNRGGDRRQFQAKLDTFIGIQCHEHLVYFLGYCVSDGERLLVYEFVPNKTLEFHLHGKDVPTMDWPTRMKVALGVAKGLAYLHEDCHPKIIHRDIKASNILLDHNFDAKVADFGLEFIINNIDYARLIAVAPFGYLAPEYLHSGEVTDKSDVFSFGVVLLELITGKPPVDSSFIDWARAWIVQFLELGENYEQFVDPRLGENFNVNEMRVMIACAASCICYDSKRRPRMSQVVRKLQLDL